MLWRVTFFSILAAGQFALAAEKPAAVEFAIALHGGAGVEPAKLSDDEKRRYEQALRSALIIGRDLLAQGRPALEAVEQTVRALEDEPLFNAGKGAVFNSEGRHELDASIMDGKTRAAGGVAGVTTVKNPISLARLVMTQTKHVLLMGEGAEKFADEQQKNPAIERVPNTYFSTDVRRAEWRKAVEKLAREAPPPAKQDTKQGRDGPKQGMDTVGCVALDKHGNLAAAASTGGLTNKKWGRVGSIPIVGAGAYADNRTCAVCGTGTGEEFIRNSIGFHLHALMIYREQTLEQAVQHIVDKVLQEDTGGIIAIDRRGQIQMRCNTPGMARAATDSRGKIEILLAR